MFVTESTDDGASWNSPPRDISNMTIKDPVLPGNENWAIVCVARAWQWRGATCVVSVCASVLFFIFGVTATAVRGWRVRVI
jgi:hypothetical protein